MASTRESNRISSRRQQARNRMSWQWIRNHNPEVAAEISAKAALRYPPDPTPPKGCGTVAAYHRHLRHGEKACAECLAAQAEKSRRDRQARAAVAS